jgi:hypothetical protein
METVNVGIIGGCMTCQPNMKLSRLFFRLFAKKLMDQDNVKCYVNLKYYNEYHRIPELAEQLINKSNPGVIILQVRPAPFIMRSEFLIQDYKGKFIINPLIQSPANIERIENILATKDPVFIRVYNLPWNIKRFVLEVLMRNNIRLGNLFLLEKKATRSLISIIDRLINLCRENSITLYVVGTISSSYKTSDSSLSGMNESLKKFLSGKGIEYLDIYSLISKDQNLYFSEDKYHLNELGHELVAGILYKRFKNQANP